MFCSHCGKEIRDDASFCPECGAPVYRKEDEQKAAEDLEKSSAVFEENGKSAAFGPDGTISDSGQTSASDSKQSSAGGGTFIRLSRILTAEPITAGRGKMHTESNREKARRAR